MNLECFSFFGAGLFRTDKDKERKEKKRLTDRQINEGQDNWPGRNCLEKNKGATMDSAAQASGEKRVNQFLIEPLQRKGLAKPTTLTKAQFDDMVKDLCARLAYMTDQNLQALEDQCAGNAGGKGKDRFPIANHILDWAGDIQSPEGDGSPLVRAVFAQALGLDALAQGWAPELLGALKRSRRWPSSFVVKSIRDRADDAIRQMRNLEEQLARGGAIPPAATEWRNRRLSVIRRCQDIADLGSNQEGRV